ncbi:hypothetical protein B0H17DRAFT_1245297 [Mycena rosella]|uniref:Uncharacterized protein n=1 Tax=Mycena rosella TaxID=1033263 RepID=A0AAD7G8S4_MYCRO|nr:hypothetical protein B0H17DRAFT_1245297 [Mycena rosella]
MSAGLDALVNATQSLSLAFFCCNSCCQPRFVCLPGDPSLAALSALARRKFYVVCEGDEGGAAIYTHWSSRSLANVHVLGISSAVHQSCRTEHEARAIWAAFCHANHQHRDGPVAMPPPYASPPYASPSSASPPCTPPTSPRRQRPHSQGTPTKFYRISGSPRMLIHRADAELAMTTSRATSLLVGNSLADVKGSCTPNFYRVFGSPRVQRNRGFRDDAVTELATTRAGGLVIGASLEEGYRADSLAADLQADKGKEDICDIRVRHTIIKSEVPGAGAILPALEATNPHPAESPQAAVSRPAESAQPRLFPHPVPHPVPPPETSPQESKSGKSSAEPREGKRNVEGKACFGCLELELMPNSALSSKLLMATPTTQTEIPPANAGIPNAATFPTIATTSPPNALTLPVITATSQPDTTTVPVIAPPVIEARPPHEHESALAKAGGKAKQKKKNPTGLPRKAGNPGRFFGARLAFLKAQLPIYLATTGRGGVTAFYQKLFPLWWAAFPWYEGYAPDGTAFPEEEATPVAPCPGSDVVQELLENVVDASAMTSANSGGSDAPTAATGAPPTATTAGAPLTATTAGAPPTTTAADAPLEWPSTGGINPTFKAAIQLEVTAQVKHWFSHRKTIQTRNNKNPFVEWLEGFQRPGPLPHKLLLQKFCMQQEDYYEGVEERFKDRWASSGLEQKYALDFRCKCMKELLDAEPEVRAEIVAQRDEEHEETLAEYHRHVQLAGNPETPDASKQEAAAIPGWYLEADGAACDAAGGRAANGRTVSIGGVPGQTIQEWDPQGFKTKIMAHFMNYLSETNERGAAWGVAPVAPANSAEDRAAAVRDLLPTSAGPVPATDTSAVAPSATTATDASRMRKGRTRRRSEDFTETPSPPNSRRSSLDRSPSPERPPSLPPLRPPSSIRYRQCSTTPVLPESHVLMPDMAAKLTAMPTMMRREELAGLTRLHVTNFNRENALVRNKAMMEALDLRAAVEDLFPPRPHPVPKPVLKPCRTAATDGAPPELARRLMRLNQMVEEEREKEREKEREQEKEHEGPVETDHEMDVDTALLALVVQTSPHETSLLVVQTPPLQMPLVVQTPPLQMPVQTPPFETPPPVVQTPPPVLQMLVVQTPPRETPLLSLETPLAVDTSAWPRWMLEEYGLLNAEMGAEWQKVVRLWAELKQAYGFQTLTAALPTSSRPAEVGQWIKYRRSTTRETKIDKLEVLSAKWWKWWSALAPTWRKKDDEGLPVTEERVGGDWGVLVHPGANGMAVVLWPLTWWRKKEGSGVASDSW